MTDNSPKAVAARFWELYSDGTPDSYGSERFMEVWSEDVIVDYPASERAPGRRLVGKEANRANHAQVAALFRNRRVVVREMVAEGDRVVARYAFTCTAAVDLPGLRAGSVMQFDGADFCTVRDGLVVEFTMVSGPYLRADDAAPGESATTLQRIATQMPNREATATADNSPRAVVLRHYDLYNDGTPDSYGSERFMEVWSEDAVTDLPASAQAPARRLVGREANRAEHTRAASSFRNRHVTVHEVVAEGDRVSVRYSFTFTAAPGVPGIPAGAALQFDGVDFFTVRDGLIVEYTGVMGPILPADGK